MVTSTIEPETIQLDYVKNGQAYILVHWDAEEIEKETDTGTETLWQYEECCMWWVLPKYYATRAGVQKYLTSAQAEILEWAQGSTVNL